MSAADYSVIASTAGISLNYNQTPPPKDPNEKKNKNRFVNLLKSYIDQKSGELIYHQI